jgi:hypothetical protein
MLKPGNGDKVNMIRHQAVSPNPNGMFDALLGQHFEVCVAIDIIQEHVRFPISALRDVVWIFWQGNSMGS